MRVKTQTQAGPAADYCVPCVVGGGGGNGGGV